MLFRSSPLVIDNFENSPGASTYLYDAALSTSAAPVYFPPYQHPQFGWCSDGGLFANNPAALAIGRVIEAGESLSDIVVKYLVGLLEARILRRPPLPLPQRARRSTIASRLE